MAECVSQFSRGAPTQACLSANKLLSCSLGSIQMECGNEGADWVLNYVIKFATAIDPRCKLSSQLPSEFCLYLSEVSLFQLEKSWESAVVLKRRPSSSTVPLP